MTHFDSDMSQFQAAWRSKHCKSRKSGTQNGKEYSWILPASSWEEGLWRGISKGDDNCPGGSIQDYVRRNDVHKHTGVHNLKSSWMLCANLYFPFRRDTPLLAGFLRERVSPLIQDVDGLELEYADESPELSPTLLLGEPKGVRGQNQTSPDVAFLVKTASGRKGIVLLEVKFTEHSFYRCSGRKKKYGNPDPKRCLDFKRLCSQLRDDCYLLHWQGDGRENRKYWDYLTISHDGRLVLKRCPAATAGYQLLRQQALAEAFLKKGNYELAISAVAYDERNQTLVRCLKTTGIKDFSKGWRTLFEGRASFASFTHQQWVAWVRTHGDSQKWKDWLEYVRERYGY